MPLPLMPLGPGQFSGCPLGGPCWARGAGAGAGGGERECKSGQVNSTETKTCVQSPERSWLRVVPIGSLPGTSPWLWSPLGSRPSVSGSVVCRSLLGASPGLAQPLGMGSLSSPHGQGSSRAISQAYIFLSGSNLSALKTDDSGDEIFPPILSLPRLLLGKMKCKNK